MIWFIPQTGEIFYRKPEAPTNYYVYTLPKALLGRVKMALEAATLGVGGWQYDDEFLQWLNDNDRPPQGRTRSGAVLGE